MISVAAVIVSGTLAMQVHMGVKRGRSAHLLSTNNIDFLTDCICNTTVSQSTFDFKILRDFIPPLFSDLYIQVKLENLKCETNILYSLITCKVRYFKPLFVIILLMKPQIQI